MHTCPPPLDALEDWLTANGTVEGQYGHLLLEQTGASDDALLDALRPYFESAHLDAREHFHEQVGLSLHPDADGPGAGVCYPNCLPTTARRGLFGEVVAGLVTQAYQADIVGEHTWSVPIFLFRYHADVEAYLWTLARDPARERQVFGRFGSDFIGLSLDAAGAVVRVIAGEAKWRATLTASAVQTLLLGPRVKDEKTGEMKRTHRGVWYELNRDTPVPHGLRQLQRLLEHRDPDGHAAAILSIDRAIALDGPPLARTNLLLIAGNGAATREASGFLIPWDAAPAEYTASHPLQVVELILTGGEDLIDELYDKLWQDVA